MRFVPRKLLTTTFVVLSALGLAGLGVAYLARVRSRPDGGEPPLPAGRRLPAELVSGAEHALRLRGGTAGEFGLTTAEVQKAPPPKPLQLPGTLLLDTDALARVRTRFAGEVIEVSPADGAAGDALEPSSGGRPVRPGDRVKKDQLLAVVWSKDLGEKKSELVDALARLRLDQETLRRLEETYQKNAAPVASLREAERNVEAGRIAAERARNTLRTWRLAEDEIQAVEREAQSNFPRKNLGDQDGTK